MSDVENTRFGILGESLPHSYSPLIHSRLADYKYEILERSEKEVRAIFDGEENLDGFNVTIPYKKLAMSLCSSLSTEARAVGAVNTVVRLADGSYKGYNTDIYGFEYMLASDGIDVKDRDCLVLGTGGASVAIEYSLNELGAREVRFCSRSGDINYSNVYSVASSTQVIVNTTPVGMYPAIDESPIDVSRFKSLEAVADIVYNPSRTRLIQDAKSLGIKTSGGLSMLVAQAYKASRIFMSDPSAERQVDVYDVESNKQISSVVDYLTKRTQNIVLIGMPGSGKTTIGFDLALLLEKEFVDLDERFEEEYDISPAEAISTLGEDEFRRMESLILRKEASCSGLVISTGGGIVMRPDNEFYLRCNSKVIYIKRPLTSLRRQDTRRRPLSREYGVDKLFELRSPLYEKMCDEIWELPNFSEDVSRLEDYIEKLY